MMKPVKVEVCVENLTSARIAQESGADRIELCSALSEGGATPSAGLIRTVRNELHILMHVLVRPRRGNFLYNDDEFACMKEDVLTAKELGADGVVIGLLTADGEIDRVRTAALITLARPMSVTIHRAFDSVKDPVAALETCIELGVDRILTSGQQQKAEAGIPLLRQLVAQAGDRLTILPGSGMNAGNILRIIEETGASEVHLSAKERIAGKMTYRKDEVPLSNSLPLSEYEVEQTSPIQLRKAMQQIDR